MTQPLLILASASPRRRDLLAAAGVQAQVHPADCDERWIPPESPVDYTARVARDKARARSGASLPACVQGRTAWVLAADTTVWIPGHDQPLGKPADRDQARSMLERLFDAGEHRVTTAYCVMDGERQAVLSQEAISTRVWMRRPGPAELEGYLDSLEWRDKAGGYGIQGAAAGLVTRLEGSYTNVVGLPVAEVLASFERLHAERS